MNNLPKVSIIIPCFNQASYLVEALESALNQTYSNIEIVCVNDGSTDNSSEIFRKYADKYKNILFFNETINRGVCFVRNLAVKACTGEYILPLDADDIIEPDYVEKAVNVLEEKPEVGIVYCCADFFGVKNKRWELAEYQKEKMFFENLIFNSALFRKKDFEKVGGYKECMHIGCEDWDLWLSLIENGAEVFRIDEILFHYRRTGLKSRTDKAFLSRLEVFKEIFRNHQDLYLNNEEFYRRLFDRNCEIVFSNKYHKYKKLWEVFIWISIVELVLLMGVICFL